METQPGAQLNFELEGAPNAGNTVVIRAKFVGEDGFDLSKIGEVRLVATPQSDIVEIEDDVIIYDPSSKDPAIFKVELRDDGRTAIRVRVEQVATGNTLHVAETELKVDAAK